MILLLVMISFCFSVGSLAASQNQDKEEELFFVAQKAFEDGFYDVALNYLERFLKDYPQTKQRPKASLLIGECYLYQDQYLKALKQFQSLQDMPENQEIEDAVLFWLGEVYFKGRDYESAQSYYHKLISKFPDSEYLAYACYSLGWSLFEQGKFREAIKGYEKFINDFPEHELVDKAIFNIAQSLYNLKDFIKAEEYFDAYIERFSQKELIDQVYFYLGELNYYQDEFEEAITNYSKAIDMSKEDEILIASKTGLGWSYLKIKKYDKAKAIFKEVESLSENNGSTLDSMLLGQATLLSELDNYKEAVEVYQQIINSIPESELLADAYLGKANSLYALDMINEAVSIYKMAVEKFKDDISKNDLIDKAYFGLAWSYLKLNSLSDAIKEFQAVAEITNDKNAKIRALYQIGDIYQDAGNLEKSLDAYDEILRDYPESFYSDYVQYQEGVVLLKLERIDAATVAFQSLKTNFPDSKYIDDSGYYLALAYFKKGNFILAKKQLEDLKQNLNYESMHKKEASFLLGATLYNLEEYKNALNTYNIIVREFSNDEELLKKAQYEIANCFYQMGKVSDALKKFKIIIYKFPESDVAFDALNWLGDYYLDMNDFDAARKYFKKIIDDFSDKQIVEKAYYEIGRSYYEEQKFDQALEQFKVVKEISDGKLSGFASLNIVEILTSREDNNFIINEYEKILVQYPKIAKQVYSKLAQFYDSLNKHNKALELFQKALGAPVGKSEIRNSQIQFNIAQILEKKGDFNSAVESYFKVTYLYPKDKLAVKSYLRIARIFENEKKWNNAEKIYKRIIAEKIEESKFAQERLERIKENISY